MNQSVICAPINEKRFVEYGIPFCDTYNKMFSKGKENVQYPNVSLIFRDEREEDIFRKLYKGKSPISIVCTEELYCSKPISQKKIFGVRDIFDRRDNVINVGCIDIDTVFIKEKNFHEHFEQLKNRKSFFVSKSTNKGIIENVGKDAAKIFYPYKDDYKRLVEITEDFTLYFWFNDIPVYHREYFYDFLDCIDYDANVKKLKYTTFDFILYAWFLLLHRGYKLEKLDIPAQDKGSFIEAQKHLDPAVFKKAFESYQPGWIFQENENIDMKNVFMRLHTDR